MIMITMNDGMPGVLLSSPLGSRTVTVTVSKPEPPRSSVTRNLRVL